MKKELSKKVTESMSNTCVTPYYQKSLYAYYKLTDAAISKIVYLSQLNGKPVWYKNYPHCVFFNPKFGFKLLNKINENDDITTIFNNNLLRLAKLVNNSNISYDLFKKYNIMKNKNEDKVYGLKSHIVFMDEDFLR